MTIPHPKLNGGLYTGEPFTKDAPWANVPVVPDVDYMTNINLKTANPPPGAIYQYPGHNRPGNNEQNMPGVVKVARLAQACIQPSLCGKTEYEPLDGSYSKWASM